MKYYAIAPDDDQIAFASFALLCPLSEFKSQTIGRFVDSNVR